MSALTLSIIAAVSIFTVDDHCPKASHYPDPQPGEVTGYVVFERCAFPTTAELDGDALIALLDAGIAAQG